MKKLSLPTLKKTVYAIERLGPLFYHSADPGDRFTGRKVDDLVLLETVVRLAPAENRNVEHGDIYELTNLRIDEFIVGFAAHNFVNS